MHHSEIDDVYEYLDPLNFRIDARSLAADHMDGVLDSEREVNTFIAAYAEMILSTHFACTFRVTTTQHDEAVIITHPDNRSPAWRKSFIVPFRKGITGNWPANLDTMGRREYKNRVRDTLARSIREIVNQARNFEEQRRLQQATGSRAGAEHV